MAAGRVDDGLTVPGGGSSRDGLARTVAVAVVAVAVVEEDEDLALVVMVDVVVAVDMVVVLDRRSEVVGAWS